MLTAVVFVLVEHVPHGDHMHSVPEHRDWHDADAAEHTPGTAPISGYGKRRLLVAESSNEVEKTQKADETKSKKQWSNYYTFHGGGEWRVDSYSAQPLYASDRRYAGFPLYMCRDQALSNH